MKMKKKMKRKRVMKKRAVIRALPRDCAQKLMRAVG